MHVRDTPALRVAACTCRESILAQFENGALRLASILPLAAALDIREMNYAGYLPPAALLMPMLPVPMFWYWRFNVH